jgi:hypothetical protein
VQYVKIVSHSLANNVQTAILALEKAARHGFIATDDGVARIITGNAKIHAIPISSVF